MTDQQPSSVLAQLRAWGHFDNPSAPNAQDAREDFDRLQFSDVPAREAVRSLQEFMAFTLDEYTQIYHKRDSVADGYIGPATELLFLTPRCGMPDYPGPEAVADANWPTECRSKLRCARNFPQLPGLSKADTDRTWWGICNIWTAACKDIVIDPVFDSDEPPGKFDFWAFLRNLPGSTLAWHELAQDTCNTTLDGAWDSGRQWNLVGATTTGAHEFGHGFGHNHVRDGRALMYPSINAAANERRGWLNDTDFRQARQLGYTVDNPQKPTEEELWSPRDEPGPPDPGSELHLPWRLTYIDPDTGRKRRYRLYPEIDA